MEIRSFDEVTILQNSLVVCDIDETLLYFDGIDKKWWSQTFDEFYRIHNDYDKADKLSLDKWISHINNNNPYITDESGYNNMLKRINDTNSKLVFLTARYEYLRNTTLKHLFHLNIHNPILHFTGGQCKGRYIFDNLINPIPERVIFIDDLQQNINDVRNNITNIECYLFIYQS